MIRLECSSGIQRIGIDTINDDWLDAGAPDHFNLGRTRRLGDENSALMTKRFRRIGDGRAMIAPRSRNNASFWNIGRQQAVEGSPCLETAGVLQMFELQRHWNFRDKIVHLHHRCSADMGADSVISRRNLGLPRHVHDPACPGL